MLRRTPVPPGCWWRQRVRATLIACGSCWLAGWQRTPRAAGIFAIHGAAASGSVAALHFLVDAGAHLEALDQFGNTAVTRAAFFGNAEVVAFLVSAGADPNAYAKPNNLTPLMAVLDGWAMSLSGRSPRLAPKEEERFNAASALIQAGGRSAPRS